MGYAMETDTIHQLIKLNIGLGIANIAAIGVERLAAIIKPEAKNSMFNSKARKFSYEILIQNETMDPRALKGVDEMCSFKLSDHIFSSFHDRLKENHREWNYKNDNSQDWNEWAKRNPRRARDICLEAEYFYGDGKILPEDWNDIVN